MIKVAFILKIALMNIRRNKLISVSKFFPSLFCMFFALFLIGSYGGGIAFVRERCSFKDMDSLKMYVAEDVGKLPTNPQDTEHFIFYAQNNRVMFNGRYLAGVGISLTDKLFVDLFENFCTKGRYITAGESECVIGNEISEKYKIGVSDRIAIGAREYTVCGITENAGYRNTILLCDSRELDIGCPQIFISHKTLYGNGLVYEGQHIQDYFASMTGLSDFIPIAAMCVAMLFFSALNVLNITVINVKKSALRVRIQRSLGATKNMIFTIRFVENLMINILALMSAFVLIKANKRTVLILFSTTPEIPLWGIASALILSLFLSLFYSIGISKKEDLCSM